jgi:hypothetical protein
MALKPAWSPPIPARCRRASSKASCFSAGHIALRSFPSACDGMRVRLHAAVIATSCATRDCGAGVRRVSSTLWVFPPREVVARVCVSMSAVRATQCESVLPQSAASRLGSIDAGSMLLPKPVASTVCRQTAHIETGNQPARTRVRVDRSRLPTGWIQRRCFTVGSPSLCLLSTAVRKIAGRCRIQNDSLQPSAGFCLRRLRARAG